MARLNVIGHPDGVSFGLYRQLGPDAVEAGREAVGFDRILLCAGVLAVVGAILCLVLIRPKDFVEHGAPA